MASLQPTTPTPPKSLGINNTVIKGLSPATTPNGFIPGRSSSVRSSLSRPIKPILPPSAATGLTANGASSSAETGLYLKRVIGCSNTAFDSHPASRSFAYTAGAAAVVITLDDSLRVQQRFFRARPNAPTWGAASQQVDNLRASAFAESRTRLSISLKDLGIGYSPASIATPGSLEDANWGSGNGSKTWSARERVKAATCVSFSPDGRWLAVGEVGFTTTYS